MLLRGYRPFYKYQDFMKKVYKRKLLLEVVLDRMQNKRSGSKQLTGRGHQGPKAYKPPYQLKRMNWEFHAYDRDFSPSVPHGHSGKYRLNVITGAVIDTTTGIILAFLDKKEMERLLKDKKFQSLAVIARQFYLEINPGVSLPNIEFNVSKKIGRTKGSKLGINNRLHNRIIRRSKRSTIPIFNRNLRYIFKTTVKFKN